MKYHKKYSRSQSLHIRNKNTDRIGTKANGFQRSEINRDIYLIKALADDLFKDISSKLSLSSNKNTNNGILRKRATKFQKSHQGSCTVCLHPRLDTCFPDKLGTKNCFRKCHIEYCIENTLSPCYHKILSSTDSCPLL